jgi:16S rRNA (cytosine967-C5)-methyltransferase
VHNVKRRLLEGLRDPWIKRHAGGFERVLIDAPCTGSGTWRRNPDQRWRLGADALAALAAEQQTILDSAARLVKPGGRLVYATCSFFREENEAQVEGFVAGNPSFALLPVAEAWRAILPGTDLPPGSAAGPMLMLTPARHGTDGFFLAILERKAATPS